MKVIEEVNARGVSSLPDLIPKLYLPVLLILVAAYAWRPLFGSDDFWVHAAVGRWIWQHRQIPHETLFLWSAKQPWIAHSWLTQLLFYGFMAVGGEHYGPYLAAGFAVLMVALVFTLLWRFWARRAPIIFLTPFLFALAIQCSRDRFAVRPELFTALFLTCLLIFLTDWAEQPPQNWQSIIHRNKYKVLGIVLLFVAWTNLHGAVAVGLVILGVTAACELVQDRFSQRAWTLAVVGLLCVGAVCVNPYGIHYWQALRQPQLAQFTVLDEWKPFWEEPLLPAEFLVEAALLLITALVAWALNPRHRWAHLIWLLLLTAALLSARRYLWLFSVVCLAVTAANANAVDIERWWAVLWSKRIQQAQQEPTLQNKPQKHTPSEPPPLPVHWRGLARWGALLYLVMWILVSPLWYAFSPRAVSSDTPIGIVNFIEQYDPPGRLFNGFVDAPYLQWRFGERRQLFIDHLNASSDQLMIDYLHVIEATPRGLELLESKSFNIGYVVLKQPPPGQPWPELARYLRQSPQWSLRYRDEVGAVWVRRTF